MKICDNCLLPLNENHECDQKRPIFRGSWSIAFPAAQHTLGYMPLTARQMGEEGYRTGKHLPLPVGAVCYKDGYLLLYNPESGVKKSAPTPAQIAARQRRESLKYCSRCGSSHREELKFKQPTVCEQCEVLLWARDIFSRFNPNNVLILDTETTGLNVKQDEIVQIGIINSAGEVLLDTLVNAPRASRMLEKSDSGICAQDIHGIQMSDVQAAPSVEAVFTEMFQLINSASVLLIYNWDYDWTMITNMAQRYGIEMPALPKSYCLMEQYAIWFDEWSDYRESYKWQKLPNGDHSAIGDCKAALDVFKEIARCPNYVLWQGQQSADTVIYFHKTEARIAQNLLQVWDEWDMFHSGTLWNDWFVANWTCYWSYTIQHYDCQRLKSLAHLVESEFIRQRLEALKCE